MAALGIEAITAETGFTLWAPLLRQVTLAWGGEAHVVKVAVAGPDRQVLWRQSSLLRPGTRLLWPKPSPRSRASF